MFRIFCLTNAFLVTIWCSQRCHMFGFFSGLLTFLKVNFTCRYLSCQMPLSYLPNSFSTVKTAAHANKLILIYNFISFSVYSLLLICVVKYLRANITCDGILILVFIFSKSSTLSLLFHISLYYDACISCNDSLTSCHTIQVLCDIPSVTRFNINNLVSTFNCLLNGRLSILSFIFLHLLHLGLGNVNFLFKDILFNRVLIIIFLSVLSVLSTLWDPWCNNWPTGLHTLHEQLIAFCFATILTLLGLYWLRIRYISLIR